MNARAYRLLLFSGYILAWYIFQLTLRSFSREFEQLIARGA